MIDHGTLPELNGWRRLAAAMVGIVLYKLLGSDLGHLTAPLRRGRFLMCFRFDWWCGLNMAEVKKNRIREYMRMLSFVFCVCVVNCHYKAATVVSALWICSLRM